eukprot:TRINITY_DN2423_c3_g1_i5.p2 TRINITY_DN2423_c3_g1~~TRINITY_DN2423_c3_g1_i5.p2  ORF type:complete len:167 (-),score=5.35 TRINITY_DN2423_c3_g1_i5:305-805(-)
MQLSSKLGLLKQAVLLVGAQGSRYELRAISSISSRESVAQVAARVLGTNNSYKPSLEQALQICEPACVVTEAQHPFRICHVNQAWVDLCGWSEGEAVGNTLKIIQGPSTSVDTKCEMHRIIKNRQQGVFLLVNYQKNGTPFFNKLGILPIEQGGQVTHFMGLLQKL